MVKYTSHADTFVLPNTSALSAYSMKGVLFFFPSLPCPACSSYSLLFLILEYVPAVGLSEQSNFCMVLRNMLPPDKESHKQEGKYHEKIYAVCVLQIEQGLASCPYHQTSGNCRVRLY